MPDVAGSTITSATLAPVSAAMGSSHDRTLANRAAVRCLPSPSAGRGGCVRALAPPRMSEPRKVRALSQAVATISAMLRPLAAIFAS